MIITNNVCSTFLSKQWVVLMKKLLEKIKFQKVFMQECHSFYNLTSETWFDLWVVGYMISRKYTPVGLLL